MTFIPKFQTKYPAIPEKVLLLASSLDAPVEYLLSLDQLGGENHG